MTITGTNFTHVMAVEFDAADATSFTVNDSPTSITAISPEGTSGTVDLTVTTSGGTSGMTTADHFKFQAPTVTSVSPGSGPTVGGTLVTVTGSGFGLGSAATTFTFAKTPGTSVNCTSSTECTVVAPAAAKAATVDVRATVSGKRSKKTPPADQFIYN